MYKTIQLVLDEVDLNGTQRFMADGLAGEESCRVLVKLAKNFAIEGDGYETPTPHTSMEKLSGLTLGQAAVLLYYDRLNSAELEPFFEISNLARDLLVNQFQLKQKLYFTYSHLVCRSAISHLFQNRTDFSHSVHADNCNLINEQLCQKLPPSYYWRDYSAIVYLNDNFMGGEFIFASDMNGTRVQSAVKPKCGRMVGFSSGPENLHGVKAVGKGTRCALAMWFTFDGRREESERSYAYELYKAKKLSL